MRLVPPLSDSARPIPSLVFRGLLPFLFLGFLGHAQETAPSVVTVLASKSREVEQEFVLTGTVSPRRVAELSSRTEGLIAEVTVDAGSRVQPGDRLATLDTRLAELDLALIRAEIAEAEIELAEARRREEEVREVSLSGAFAKTEAEARRSAMRLREAALARLRVQEESVKERIERHHLIAPFGGVIAEKRSEVGEWVETGDPVLRLVELDQPRFDLRVPQEFLPRLSSTTRIHVVLDAYPDRPLEADIEVRVPVKDEASRTFLTRLALTDPDSLAAPGMSGKARVGYRSAGEAVVTLPRDTIMREPSGIVKVWVVAQEDGETRVSARVIRLAQQLGPRVEVIEGLSGGEQVVLKGNEGLREGQRVHVAETVQPHP